MRKLLLIAATLVLAAGCARPPADGDGSGDAAASTATLTPRPTPRPTPKPARSAQHKVTAEQVVVAFKQAGLPVVAYTVYTADIDEQHLLGKPGQYTSKATFSDGRLVGDGGERSGLRGGGVVEVFASAPDAARRAARLAGTSRLHRNGAVLLRLDSRLGSRAAARYQAVLAGLLD
jgi:hypothetical protein